MTIAWPTTGDEVAKSGKWDESQISALEDYAAVAVSRIEEKVGPWNGQTLTHTAVLRGTRSLIALPWPVAQATVTRDGEAVETAAVDRELGVIYGEFPPGEYEVTATARPGSTCPADVRLAARKLGSHLAKQELIGPRQPGFAGAADKDLDVLQGFALPRAVSELIAPYVFTGAFA